MNLFLDTNAVVKLYHDELGSQALINFLYSYTDNLIITITDLTIIEFHSTFLKLVRTRKIDHFTVVKIFKYFDNDLQAFNIIEVNNVVKRFAIRLFRLYRI